MGVKYQDYYKLLGVGREASQKEIQSAYRKLARKYHPDVNKAADADEKFKEINEAYEVLKDPEKRKLYDQLGPNWKAGQDFTPPPGWDSSGFGRGGQRTYYSTGDQGDFSDFFETMFGRGGFGGFGGFDGFTTGRKAGRDGWSMKGEDREAEINITLEEAYHGGSKKIQFQVAERQSDGRVNRVTKDYNVKIPKGITEGKIIRLKGQGSPGSGGGPAGDLFLKVQILPHKTYKIEGDNLVTEIKLAPWEAILGSKLEVPTLDGRIKMSIPPGTQTDQRFRLRGKGMPTGTDKGDLYVVAKIVVPTSINSEEQGLIEEWAKKSNFNPRI